jgi:hypothetical protein
MNNELKIRKFYAAVEHNLLVHPQVEVHELISTGSKWMYTKDENDQLVKHRLYHSHPGQNSTYTTDSRYGLHDVRTVSDTDE